MKTETLFIQGLQKEVTFWIGTSKQDNDEMIDTAAINDIWFHAKNISSCHVICKLPVGVDKKEMKYIIKMGAILCKKNTNKLKSGKNIEFVYTAVQHITKTDILGCVNITNEKSITI